MTFGFGTTGEIKMCEPSRELRAIRSREEQIERIVAARLAAQKEADLARELAEIAERKRKAYNEKRRAYHAANKDRINARRRELRAEKKAKLVTLF